MKETITYAVHTLRCKCGFVASARTGAAVDNAMLAHLGRLIDPSATRFGACGFPHPGQFEVTARKHSQYLVPIGITREGA